MPPEPLIRDAGTIIIINGYISRLTNGAVASLVQVEPGLYRVDFRAGLAKIRLQVDINVDCLLLYSTLFNLAAISATRHYELFDELLRLNASTATMSAKFAISNDNYVEIIAARRELRELDYHELVGMLRNVCNVASDQGTKISTKYELGASGAMEVQPIEE